MLVKELKQFYKDNRQGLYTYALSLTRNHESAEDVVHSVFLKILQKEQIPSNIKPYIFRCIRNQSMDIWRDVKKNDDLIFEIYSEENSPLDKEITERLGTELKKLNSDERETIILKIYDNMTFKEIAHIRDASINTVTSWYRRGLKKLKSLIKDEF